MIDRAAWFGPAGEELFGWYCAPDDGRAALGVLLCSSVGEEEHNAHETFRQLAFTLAQRGVASLRFDYHGTGDSTGEWGDPDRVVAWSRSIAVADSALRQTGVPRVAAVGMRFGAALLATVAARGEVRPAAVVLWDPCNGKELLREGHARRPPDREPPEGFIDTPGYRYAPETAAAMRETDPAGLGSVVIADSMLVLTRTDRPTPRRLRQRLDRQGVTWGDAHGQTELLDLPMTEAAVPIGAVERIATWLSLFGDAEPTQLTLPDTDGSLCLSAEDGSSCSESVVRLGSAELVGVLTRPETTTRAPLVVFVNVANDRHVGPGRSWVTMARQWAAHGFESLRLDQTGVGDSPVRNGVPFGTLYAREWLEDLPDSLADARLGSRPLAMVSLCSGAYSCMETAFLSDVRAVYAINPVLHARMTSPLSPLGDRRRRVGRPPTRPFLYLADRQARLSALLWRLYRQLAVWHAPLSVVGALVQRGTDVILVMSPNDARHFWEDLYWSVLQAPRWRRSGHYRMLSSGEVDHPLMTQSGQGWARQTITQDLVERFPGS